MCQTFVYLYCYINIIYSFLSFFLLSTHTSSLPYPLYPILNSHIDIISSFPPYPFLYPHILHIFLSSPLSQISYLLYPLYSLLYPYIDTIPFFSLFLLFLTDNDSDNGVTILFDGQKQYPTAKVTVDFTFVEHTAFDCIEIIGICIPFEIAQKNKIPLLKDYQTDQRQQNDLKSSEKDQKSQKSLGSDKTPKFPEASITEMPSSSFNSPAPTQNHGNSNTGSSTVGLYSMSHEEKRLLPIIRVFVAAKVFYERIIINKKMKDKKKRRTEQVVLTVGSKMAQNMAAQSLLGTTRRLILIYWHM